MYDDFQSLAIGERVRHVVHASWGPGSVIEWLGGARFRVFFAYEGEQIVDEDLIVPDRITLH